MEKDLTKKRCLSDNGRYADLLNGTVFGGKELLRPEDLSELDSQTTLTGRKNQAKKRHRQQYQDLVRKAAFGVNFVIIGVENQEETHYLMPVRSMGYDAAQYQRQENEVRKKERKGEAGHHPG